MIVKEALRPTKWLELWKRPRWTPVKTSQVAICRILISAGRVLERSSSALRSSRALGVPCTWVPVTQSYPKILAIRTANYWTSVSFLAVWYRCGGFWWIWAAEDGFGWFLIAFDGFWYFLCGVWLFFACKNPQEDGETILIIWAVQSKYDLDLLARWCYRTVIYL